MKLNEILQPDPDAYEPKKLKQTTFKVLDKIADAAENEKKREQPRFKHKGGGGFGEVYSPTKKINTVVKYGEAHKGFYDGYLSYAREVVKNGKGNRYLPQIYSIKNFEGANGQHIFKVTMEKLQSAENISYEEAWAIVQRILHRTYDELKQYHAFEQYPIYGLMNIMREYIVYSKHETFLKEADPQFVEALDLIRAAKQASGAGIDLGVNNVMIRRTPYGSQLVIADPLA